MNKEESTDENPDGTERQKEVSFQVLEIKKNHYDNKDLISISMKVDEEEYCVSFLKDNYNAIFFPEFRELDKYHGVGGFKFLHAFLHSVNSKTKYYYDTHMKKSESINTYEKEWWMDSEDNKKKRKKESEERFNDWISKNIDYLNQCDLTGFDNNMINEMVEYLELRKDFVNPGFVKKHLEEEKDVVSLNELLENAIETEDYEEAAKIREKIKTIK